MDARDETPATPAKSEGTPESLQLSNAPRKPMRNTYFKSWPPSEPIERFDADNNCMYILTMDAQGRYIETGAYHILVKAKEEDSDLLKNINVDDLDDISQPGYSYEDNEIKRENEEGGQGDARKSISVDTPELPRMITTYEQMNSVIRKQKTQEFTPPTQETEFGEHHREETTSDEKGTDNPQYRQFMSNQIKNNLF
jgi:hypothetical protein